MYGYQYAQSGSAMKALCVFIGLILVGAIVAGVMLGDSELLSPSLNTAEADRIRAETAALRAQTAFEQQQRSIELRLAEQKADAELQALQARRAKELELLETTTTVGQVVGSTVAIVLAVAASYYLIAKARALPKGQAVREIQRSDQKTLPSISKRKPKSVPERAKSPPSIERSNVSAFHVSYEGFLAFFADFMLSNGRRMLLQDCTRSDDRRRYYPTGISPEVARTYCSILEEARIVTSGTNGRSEWTLQQRINNIDDISCRISREAFDKVATWYYRETMRLRKRRPL